MNHAGKRVRVVVACRRSQDRWSLSEVLARDHGVEVVATVSTAHDTWAEVGRLHPDVLVTDMILADRAPIPARATWLCRMAAHTTTVVLVRLTMDSDSALAAVQHAGALGALPADADAERLVTAVCSVAARLPVYTQQPRGRIATWLKDEYPRLPVLTHQERVVLERFLNGGTPQQVADALHITRATVYSHSSSLERKFDVTGRSELLLYLTREHLDFWYA